VYCGRRASRLAPGILQPDNNLRKNRKDLQKTLAKKIELATFVSNWNQKTQICNANVGMKPSQQHYATKQMSLVSATAWLD
jgi:hypothetical protein